MVIGIWILFTIAALFIYEHKRMRSNGKSGMWGYIGMYLLSFLLPPVGLVVALCMKKRNVPESETTKVSQDDPSDETHFSVGQLVVIRKSEDQFRIDSTKTVDGVVLYYSEKFQDYFSAEEIEDFDRYWANKRK